MPGRCAQATRSWAAIAIVAEQAAEPARTEFDEVYKKQNYGLPFREALLQLLERVPSQDLRVLVTGILVQKDTGGNLAEILDRILFVIKERMRIQGEIRIHTAQGRMTGWILCALPIVMLVVINLVNPGYSNVLFTNPLGKEILYIGIGLLVTGGLVIRQIINGNQKRNLMQIVFYLALAFTVFCTVALLMAPMLLKPAPEVQRVLDVTASKQSDKREILGEEEHAGQDAEGRLCIAITARIRPENAKVKERLTAAGNA